MKERKKRERFLKKRAFEYRKSDMSFVGSGSHASLTSKPNTSFFSPTLISVLASTSLLENAHFILFYVYKVEFFKFSPPIFSQTYEKPPKSIYEWTFHLGTQVSNKGRYVIAPGACSVCMYIGIMTNPAVKRGDSSNSFYLHTLAL